MKSINGCSCPDSTVVRDIFVVDGQNAIKLPDILTCKEMPASTRKISTRQSIVKWSRLHRISLQLPKFDPDSHIGIIVRNNCPEVMEPQEVIHIEGNGS